MADVEKMRINLAKNEEKLAKKIALLGKYEAKKEKLSKQWEKLTKGISYLDAMEIINNDGDNNSSIWKKLERHFGEDVARLYLDIETFYDYSKGSWNPIVQTQKGIEELERMCQSYRDKIEAEEKKASDRQSSINANTISINGKDVNIILEFLNEWQSECYNYYMDLFENYEKYGMSDYENTVKNSIEYKITYNVYNNSDWVSENWKDSEYAEYYDTYEEFVANKNKNYKDPCAKAIRDNLADLEESWYNRFGIKQIEKWGGSAFRPKKSEYEKKMVTYLEKEKNRKYDKLIIDVENIVGTIIDMSNIHIGKRGDLEGYVIGTDGEAELWTSSAGGYNTDTIVNVKHGQRFHFRFYVKRRG